jgi:hypothetical protein
VCRARSDDSDEEKGLEGNRAQRTIRPKKEQTE